MEPTREQIEVAAYHRWLRRGCEHGFDAEDWAAAEADLTFAMNYRWVGRRKLDAGGVAVGKDEAGAAGLPRRCRYCEAAEPGASFESEPLVVPRAAGGAALVAWDECDDCRAHYDEHLAEAFDDFLRSCAEPEGLAAAGVGPAAHKALVRAGLGLLPAGELHHFGDTMEWVTNPDHARDAAVLGPFGVQVYVTRSPVPSPFASLARRSADDAPLPYMLFFLGFGRVVLQVALPLCPRDEDIEDGPGAPPPALSMALGTGPDYRPAPRMFLPVSDEWEAAAVGASGMAVGR